MVELRVEWSDAAQDDVRAIAFHIVRDSLTNALAVTERLERRGDALRTLAARGRVVPELHRMGEQRFRELIEAPWRIIYLIEDRRVRVVAVVDSRRDLQEWLKEQASRFRLSRA